MHINTLDRAICKKMGIYTVAHLGHLPTPLPDGLLETEGEEYLMLHSANAWEIARLWLNAKQEADNWICPESTIAGALAFFPKRNFLRWGDESNLDGVSKKWFREDGLHLDEQASEMSEMSGFEITPADLVDFVGKWRPGQYKNPAAQKCDFLADSFRVVTGFQVKEYYARHLIKMCCFEQVLEADALPF
jgi:hypothetical protein